MTGIIDRLERGGWVARERDLSDRRAVVVRALGKRNAELLRLYSGMNASMDQICAKYEDTELELLAGFLHRTANAGARATEELARDSASGATLGYDDLWPPIPLIPQSSTITAAAMPVGKTLLQTEWRGGSARPHTPPSGLWYIAESGVLPRLVCPLV